MSAFLVLSALIFFKLCTWTRDSKSKRRVRQACFFCCFRCCQDCPPNSEIWNSLFLLSCVCAYMSAAEAMQDIFELRSFLKDHEKYFKRSNATYYTPGYKEINVILYETEGESERSRIVLELMKNAYESLNSVNCLPCEAFEETNSTTFLHNFHTFLQKVEDVLS
ncbi:interleukin-15 isoform X2 [Anguilla anguilla]|uniref:interleukin-15 isoform X2 n=1 Tax=Anguilla anguilla TaxID=7936 RepID=UPI0015AF025F|nr:interleukin-15 isoform X2 [Anguilla anguilla]